MKILSEYIDKENRLKEYLSKFDKACVAFSGGVDSTYLLRIAHDVMGDRVMAVTALSSFFAKRETNEAIDFCRNEGIKQILVRIDENDIDNFEQNPADRCYFCKKHIFAKIMDEAEKNNAFAVFDGSNADDVNDYRPGMKAKKELGVFSPLLDVGLNKKEIRYLSQRAGLSTYDKPSFACLASRFEYGDIITKEKLFMVETAEQYLFDMGFTQFRVRYHGGIARIEVLPSEFSKVLELKDHICSHLEKLGFDYISLDLKGYHTGNMNKKLGGSKNV